jgi:phosphomannomutase
MKRLVAYDLDGTLAECKQPIDPETAALLARLIKVAVVAAISRGDWPQFEQQLVGKLPADTNLDRLFLPTASGTKLYRHGARREQVYAVHEAGIDTVCVRDVAETRWVSEAIALCLT